MTQPLIRFPQLDQSSVALTGGTINNIVIGGVTPAAATFTAQSLSGTLTFTSTAQRIQGDFSNATFSNRVTFQSSTTDTPTIIQTMPNGTSTESGIAAFAGTDLANTPYAALSHNGNFMFISSNKTGTGLYKPLVFQTNGGDQWQIDTSGNLIASQTSQRIEGDFSGTHSTRLGFQTTTTNGNTQVGSLPRGSGDLAGFTAYGSSDADNASYVTMYAYAGGSVAAIDSNKTGSGAYLPLTFLTSNLERARIDASGFFLFNKTTSGSSSITQIEFDGALEQGAVYFNTDTGSGSQSVMTFVREATTTGSITHTDTVTAYNTSSDYRLKENIVPLTGASERVLQLPVNRFNFKTNQSYTMDGFLAHNVQLVVPEAVTGTKDEIDEQGNPIYQQLDYSKLVPLLTAALQEALVRIETLEAQLP